MASEAESEYRVKRVEFFGRKQVPIVMQNENGPCPLLAIANVLLLRNNISLQPEGASEIAVSRLLSLVVERLLDSNSSTEGKTEQFLQNQQQNLSDAMSVVPRLATGIDVNVKFGSVFDFEFTPETAIFDLLDISLVHGWLVDPQDVDTLKAVGNQSYNRLVERVLSHPEAMAALQTVSGSSSFGRIGDVADPASNTGTAASSDSTAAAAPSSDPAASGESLVPATGALQQAEASGPHSADSSEACTEAQPRQPGSLPEARTEEGGLSSGAVSVPAPVTPPETAEAAARSSTELEAQLGALGLGETAPKATNQGAEAVAESAADGTGPVSKNPGDGGGAVPVSDGSAAGAALPSESHTEGGVQVMSEVNPLAVIDTAGREAGRDGGGVPREAAEPEAATGAMEGTPHEPPSINDAGVGSGEGSSSAGAPISEAQSARVGEPSGEASSQPLQSEAGREAGASAGGSNEGVREALLISSFLTESASQLTYHGLFSLQESLKDQELCVFFRNNHFSTLFKNQGKLYLLVTDQGYLNQPGVVWERLNEVEGDNQFYSGDFTPFVASAGADGASADLWAAEDDAAIAAVVAADMGSFPEQGPPQGATYSSDLELAMALQQQEDESARRAMASSVHPAQRSASNPPPHSRQGPITQQLGRLSGTSSHDPRKPPTSGPQAGTRVAYPQGRWAYGEGTETSGTSIAGSTGSSSGWSSTTWFSGGSKEPSAQTRIPQAPAGPSGEQQTRRAPRSPRDLTGQRKAKNEQQDCALM